MLTPGLQLEGAGQEPPQSPIPRPSRNLSEDFVDELGIHSENITVGSWLPVGAGDDMEILR